MAHDLHGYLNVLKPPGMTSHDVVARLRRLCGQRRIGHTGTLDPAAIGVLPIALGRATRTTSGSAWDLKLYWADVRFGQATDTDDATGQVVAERSTEGLELRVLISTLEDFVGDVQQRPPAYSAVHVGGRRAYAEARRGQIEELPVRMVRIDEIRVVAWRPPIVSLLVQCRSGTYIRSIARDLGAALGCPAHLGALVRLRVGAFDIRGSLRLEELAETTSENWSEILWPPDIATTDLDALIARRERVADFLHGRAWTQESPGITVAEGLVRAYDEDGALLGLAQQTDAGWQPRLAIPSLNPVPAGVGRR